MSSGTIQRAGNYFNFIPTSVTGCSVWLDAADARRVALSGSNITTLTDKSANAYSFTVPVANPTYSTTNQAITFSPSQDNFFSFPPAAINNASRYIFIILANFKSNSQQLFAKQYDYVNTMNAFAIGRNGGGLTTAGQLGWQPQNGVNAYQTGTVTLNTRTMVVVWFDGTTLRFRINGTANSSTVGNFALLNDTSAGSGVGASMCTFGNLYSAYWRSGGQGQGPPGGGGTFNWDLHEFVYFNNDIGLSNIQLLEGYIGWKWGVQGNLPASHPYSGAPVVSVPFSIAQPFRARDTDFFSPTSISGLLCWLDTSSLAFITRSGTSVTGLLDRSGRGNNWSGSATLNTTGTLGNSLPTISSMNGTTLNDNGITGNQPMTYVWVCSGAAGGMFVRNERNFGLSFAHSIGSTNITVNINQGGTFFNATGLPSVTRIAVIQSSGTTVTLFDNGTQQASTAGSLNQSNGNTRTQGSTGFQAGEFMIFNKVLSTSERQALEGYFAWKWRLTANLPATHPFKNTILGAPNPILSVPRPITIFNQISFMYPSTGYSWYNMSAISGTTLVDSGKVSTFNGTMSTTMSLVSGPVTNMQAVNIPFGATIAMPTGYTSGSFTICFWINFAFKSGQGLTTYQYFLTGGRLQVHQYLRQSQFPPFVDIYAYVYDPNGSISYSPILDSRWYHMIFVYNTSSNQVTFYLNGSLIQTTTQTINGAGNWIIGNGSSTFSGLLADLRVVPIQLTAAQASALYSSFANGTWGVFSPRSLLTPR